MQIPPSIALPRGVTLTEGSFNGTPYHMVRIDRDQADVVVKPFLNRDAGGETVSRMTRRAGAAVGMNGTFFDTEHPGEAIYGEIKTDGGSYRPAMWKKRTYWGIRPDGSFVMNETVPAASDPTMWEIPPATWSSLRYVIGGGGRLLHGGKRVSEGAGVNDERFQDDVLARRDRSAVGYSADGRTLLLVSSDEPGWTPEETADFMLSQGMSEALFFDGGGSTDMVVEGRVVNTLSAGAERPMPTAVTVIPASPGL